MLSSAAALTLLAYIAIVIGLALRDAQSNAPESFMIADRNVGWFGTMASIAGNLRDGAGLAAWVILGIFYGFGALWLTLGLVAGLVLLATLAGTVRDAAAGSRFVSVGELIGERIGTRTARISSLVIATTALLYAAAQVHVSGQLFAGLLGIPANAGMMLTASVVAIYLALGGFQTTIRTGIFQWFIIMLVILLPWILLKGPAGGVSLNGFTSPGLKTGVAFFGISFLVVLTQADLWQLLFAARSSRHARVGLVVTIPVYFVISLGMIYFAASLARAVGEGVAPADALYAVFSVEAIPSFVRAVVGVFVAAAIMSTLDSQVFLFVSTVSREVLPTSESSEGQRIGRATRLGIVLTMIALALVASSIGDLVVYLFGAVTLGTVIAPVLLLCGTRRMQITRRTDGLIAISLLVSVLVYGALFSQGAFQELLFTLLPATIATVCVCLVLRLGRESRKVSAASTGS